MVLTVVETEPEKTPIFTPPSEVIDAGVAGDPGEPELETIRVLTGIEPLEDADENLLGEVSCLVLLAHITVGDGADSSLMLSHKHLPGQFVAVAAAFQKIPWIHGHQIFSFLRIFRVRPVGIFPILHPNRRKPGGPGSVPSVFFCC